MKHLGWHVLYRIYSNMGHDCQPLPIDHLDNNRKKNEKFDKQTAEWKRIASNTPITLVYCIRVYLSTDTDSFVAFSRATIAHPHRVYTHIKMYKFRRKKNTNNNNMNVLSPPKLSVLSVRGHNEANDDK